MTETSRPLRSSYRYQPLSSGNIRLLRLLPHGGDSAAPIRCHLIQYPLEEHCGGNHLYEALSYVWGDPAERFFICILSESEACDFEVSANLHAALLRLRDRYFERILWIDAICINQSDDKEKEHQIQSMAKIYGLANRVIVWLGEAEDDSDEMLAYIRSLAEKEETELKYHDSRRGAVNELPGDQWLDKIKKALTTLIQKPWFKRIWVLQEIALARRILITYGGLTMNGYTFSLGLSRCNLSTVDGIDPGAEQIILSICDLIKGAIVRPHYTVRRTAGVPLGELVDMYHTRESTIRHDKIFALLGMSSAVPPGLSPNYSIPWKDLFQRLVTHVLPGEQISVETWENSEVAVIKSKGWVLGRVIYVISEAHNNRLRVQINFDPKHLRPEATSSSLEWTFPVYAKSIRKGDIVCFLRKAKKPTIIRVCKNYSRVIVAEVTDRYGFNVGFPYHGERLFSPLSPESFLLEFLLVWDWDKSAIDDQLETTPADTLEIDATIPGYLKTNLERRSAYFNIAAILAGADFNAAAEDRLRAILAHGKGRSVHEDTYILHGMENLVWIYKNQDMLREAKTILSQVIDEKKRLNGSNHPDTLASIADLIYLYSNDEWALCKCSQSQQLCGLIRGNAVIPENMMKEVIMLQSYEVQSRILDLEEDKVEITEPVVVAAATKSIRVFKLLFQRRASKVPITKNVVLAVLKSWYYPDKHEMIKILFDQRRKDITITQDEIMVALGDEGITEYHDYPGGRTLEALLDNSGYQLQVTEDLVIAALQKTSAESTMRTFLDRMGNSEIVITERIADGVISRRKRGVVRLLLDRRGNGVSIPENIVSRFEKILQEPDSPW